MTKPAGFTLCALLFCSVALSVRAEGPGPVPAAGTASAASASSAPAPTAVPVANPAPPAAASRVDPKKRLRLPAAPLKRLHFSAKEGFSLRMVSNQEVTAEIRNGAGRTLARGAYTLEPGDWSLRPRNLPPGLYTVLLRTGPQLRALRLKIEDSERGKGAPEWVLEKDDGDPKGPDSSHSAEPSSQQGASVYPAPD
ncbi:MAG: hypothetical protein JWP91_2011 [Fibrobacteres bacterium]|nr:hypothetical protein [Fibrobacterota bacterium]